jgi:hypothetical protein
VRFLIGDGSENDLSNGIDNLMLDTLNFDFFFQFKGTNKNLSSVKNDLHQHNFPSKLCVGHLQCLRK